MENLSRFKDIEIYEYETDERTSFKIINFDGSVFLELDYKDIEDISLNLKCGIKLLKGRMLSVPKELELSKWKNNKKELIKKLEIKIVRNGFVKHYILNAGIQRVQEFYSDLSYIAVFKHDYNMSSLYYTMDFLSSNLRLDYKVHIPDIRNVSKGTLLGLGLSGLGLVLSTGGTITIPVGISIIVGGSTFGSVLYDFIIEYNGVYELKGQGDILQKIVGQIVSVFGKNEEIKKTMRQEGENMYSRVVFIYGLISSREAVKRLFKFKNFSQLSKSYENGYFKIKDIKLKSSTNGTIIQGAKRNFESKVFINDVANTIGAGQSIYDRKDFMKIED